MTLERDQPGLADAVARRLAVIRDRIAGAGGDADRVTIVAVTKGFGSAAVRAALAAGLSDIGENYAQELDRKRAELASESLAARWHFLGHIQRNKVRHIAPAVHLWQSVDRVPAGSEIARRRPGAPVLVQVNVSGEVAKNGCRFEEVAALVAELRNLGLDVRGLMGVGPAGPPEEARPGFRRLTALADALELPVRSMGMTGDLEVAVQEGTTMVRIGRALFGPRPGAADAQQ